MFVVLRVHRTHGGELGDKLLVLSPITSSMVSMRPGSKPEEGMDVAFIHPIDGGWSGGTILHTFDAETNKKLEAGLKAPSV
jgi:hypothetical protein